MEKKSYSKRKPPTFNARGEKEKRGSHCNGFCDAFLGGQKVGDDQTPPERSLKA